jgi:hypothetical protein
MTKELIEVLEALCSMWDQYCSSDWGHDCMSAGEEAEFVLDKYALLIHGKGYKADVDWDRLQKMKQAL